MTDIKKGIMLLEIWIASELPTSSATKDNKHL
jgi:hypothetical protein